MLLVWEIIQFLIYSILIVAISKYLLVKVLRTIGELLNLKSKTIGNIAGIATSIPELLTVSFSAFTGLIAASTYNIISSNIINLVQYGVSVALNKNQYVLKNKAIKIDLFLVILTIIIPIIMLIFNIENTLIIVPIFIIILFVFYRITNNAHKLYIKEKKDKIKEEVETKKELENEVLDNDLEKKNLNISIANYTKKNVFNVVMQACLLVLIGVVLYFIGSMLSNILNNLCRQFNIPEFFIGILLGLITSIPELITFFESQKYHKEDNEGIIEATGNLLTSNIMNLFVIQSIAIIIYYIFQ